MSFEQRLDKVASEITDIVKKKNKDYGNSYEMMIDKYGLVALLIRFQDKMGRLDNLVLKDSKIAVVDESIEDTLKDIAGYALLELARLEKGKPIQVPLGGLTINKSPFEAQSSYYKEL